MPGASDPRLAFLEAAADWIGSAKTARVRAPGRGTLALACARLGYRELARSLARLAADESRAIPGEVPRAAKDDRGKLSDQLKGLLAAGSAAGPPKDPFVDLMKILVASDLPPGGDGTAERARAVAGAALALEVVGEREESAALVGELTKVLGSKPEARVLRTVLELVHHARGQTSQPDPLAARLLELARSLEPAAWATFLARSARPLLDLGLREPFARYARALVGSKLPVVQAGSLAQALEAAEGPGVVRPGDALWVESVLLAHARELEPLDLPLLRFALGRDPAGARERVARLEAAFVAKGHEASVFSVALAVFEDFVAKGELDMARTLYEPLAQRARALKPEPVRMRFVLRLSGHAPRVLAPAQALGALVALVADGRRLFFRGEPGLASDYLDSAARFAVPLPGKGGARSSLLEILGTTRELLEGGDATKKGKQAKGLLCHSLGGVARAVRRLEDPELGRDVLPRIVRTIELAAAPAPEAKGLRALVARNLRRTEPDPLAYDATDFFARDALGACARAAFGLGLVDLGKPWFEAATRGRAADHEAPSMGAMLGLDLSRHDSTDTLIPALGTCSEESLDDSTRFELATGALARLGGEPGLMAADVVAGMVFLATGYLSTDADSLLSRQLRGPDPGER